MGIKFNPIILSVNEDKHGYAFNCPGCGCIHHIQTNPDFKPHWDYNNDPIKPTVSPSIKVTMYEGDKTKVCHSFIKDGNIQFCNDSWHHLKGKTVELPDWEEEDDKISIGFSS